MVFPGTFLERYLAPHDHRIQAMSNPKESMKADAAPAPSDNPLWFRRDATRNSARLCAMHTSSARRLPRRLPALECECRASRRIQSITLYDSLEFCIG